LVQAIQSEQSGPVMTVVVQSLEGSPLALAALAAGMSLLAHSSNAPAVLAVGFAAGGIISLPGALALVVGANLGSAVNLYLQAKEHGLEARRATTGHLLIKLVFACVCLALLEPISTWLAYAGKAKAVAFFVVDCQVSRVANAEYSQRTPASELP
jgi:phosphate:Na+ symporter